MLLMKTRFVIHLSFAHRHRSSPSRLVEFLASAGIGAIPTLARVDRHSKMSDKIAEAQKVRTFRWCATRTKRARRNATTRSWTPRKPIVDV